MTTSDRVLFGIAIFLILKLIMFGLDAIYVMQNMF